ncbi:MAG: MBL fold metallo-hydrolase [Candidatus Heimdallarchaeota archaeon]|nr:MBL fold metallo-hydrolase [Candidatus Heimdallarchaeota archaeon]MCK4770434.1 MBL fold metallo-hydrolase [Candidatus Heimdallarchaeota archaeon]
MAAHKIECESTGPLKTNCYLLYDIQEKEAALFDVAGSIPKLNKIIEKEGLTVKYLFCTHLHFDHVMGLEEIRNKYPEALLAFNSRELDVMENLGNFARLFEFEPSSIGKQDINIENQIFNIGKMELKTLLTPGHTPGSVCYFFDKYLFSGDVLFKRGIGRTDFYGGSFEEIMNSILGLYKFPDDTIVYPGHGESTDIGSEKRENPFVNQDSIY